MDAAVATLERTAASLEIDSELRTLADGVLAAFATWRVAKPRTEESTKATLDLGAKVHALEALAIKTSTPGFKTAKTDLATTESQATVESVAEKSKFISTESTQLKSSPFASLKSLQNDLPEGTAEPSPPPQEEETSEHHKALSGKIVISKTRKGRGGKTVTVISGIADAKLRDEIAKELRTALGCGAKVQGSEIVAQGAQETRVQELLEARGAKHVVIGT
jgi:translation initiation factor 1